MNNAYTIKVEAPLLRPGLSMNITVSHKYAVPALNEILNVVREFNSPTKEVVNGPKQKEVKK